MDRFVYQEGQLFAEEVPFSAIAEHVGTPCYVYSRAMIEGQWHAFDDAFAERDHLVCYSVKANPNLAILDLLGRLGSGFDIVSGGELERVLRAGGDPSKVVFSGVGKTVSEIRRALDVGIHCFNIESESELARLNEVAGKLGKSAPTALRVNPNIDPYTHPYIATGLKKTKFGIPIDDAVELYYRARELTNIEITGIACHIGSQLTDMAPFINALERLLKVVDELRGQGIELEDLDLGGGLGITYRSEQLPSARDYVHALIDRLDSYGSRYRHMRVMIEPGRALVGEAGLLLTRVEYLKHGEEKNFAVVDAAMNDLVRPTLYDAWHEIVPVSTTVASAARIYDVVGPVCESGDFLGRDRKLSVASGDLLAIRCAGAYGSCMSSRYNTRPLTAEVVVDKDRFHVVRRREVIDEMLATESLFPKR